MFPVWRPAACQMRCSRGQFRRARSLPTSCRSRSAWPNLDAGFQHAQQAVMSMVVVLPSFVSDSASVPVSSRRSLPSVPCGNAVLGLCAFISKAMVLPSALICMVRRPDARAAWRRPAYARRSQSQRALCGRFSATLAQLDPAPAACRSQRSCGAAPREDTGMSPSASKQVMVPLI